MANVTGKLGDFGYSAISLYMPQIIFTPSGPGVSPASVFFTADVKTSPNAADNTWSVNIAGTHDMYAEVWYTISLRWLDSAGGMSQADFPDWRLYVPAEGGEFSKLIDVMGNPLMVVTSIEPPPFLRPNLFWLDTVNSLLYRTKAA